MPSVSLKQRHSAVVPESGSLEEPLLKKENEEEKHDDIKCEKESEETGNLCHFVIKWAKRLGNIIWKTFSWIGNMVLCGYAHRSHNKFLDFNPTPLQEKRLHRLQSRIGIPFDRTHPLHQESLKTLWHLAFPDTILNDIVSEQWKDMGWQGNDPSTDFRGGGFISLENLLFFARTYPKTFQQLLHKKGGTRADWEYPFAVAGVNLTFMLIQMLDLRSEKPRTCIGINFTRILGDEETAFDRLYCVAFKLMDTLWLAMHASYMEFNAVLKATQAQLEKELSSESITKIEDMPSYSLLC